jgi:hypothetical protein
MPPPSAFDGFRRDTESRLKAAALNATFKRAEAAKNEVREKMAAAKLGRLGFAIGSGGDAEKNGAVRPMGNGWSASGWLFVRSQSPRTKGAIEAYTEGAEISPRKGRYLWIASDDLPRLVGRGADRERMTPAVYNQRGYAEKIGPLRFVRGRGGTAFLIVRSTTVSASGKPRSARAPKRNGQPRRGQAAAENVIAFIGIPRTSRAARVDVREIVRRHQALLRDDIIAELRKG